MAASVPEGYVWAGDKWYYVLHPRPVYIVASSSGGRVGFMAASWVMPFSEEPPRIVAALEKESHTVQLILDSLEFTVNVYSVDSRDFVYTAGTVSGRRVDKASLLGVKLERGVKVSAPRLAYPRPLGVIEARVYRVISDAAEDVHLVVADVVAAYADAARFNARYGWDLRSTRILMHSAGRGFTTNNGLFVARRLV